MMRKIGSMRDHYIVCGDTPAATYVAEGAGAFRP